MKNFRTAFFTLLFLAGLPLAAITDRPPVIVIRNGDAKGFIGAYAWVNKRQNAPEVPGGIRFNGKDSILIMTIPFFYPNHICSMTVVADVTPERTDSPAIIAGRTGHDNALGIDQEGRPFFNCFGPGLGSKVKAAQATSKTKLVPGRRYRLAGVLDCTKGDNNTHLTLYVNGDCAGTAVLPGAPREYARLLFAGGMMRDGKVRSPFAGTLHELYLFFKPLTRTEICRLPGQNDLKTWNAFNPVADVKTRKADELLKGGAASLYKLPNTPESVTMTARFKVNALPAKTGIICGCPGFDNALYIDAEGFLGASSWNAYKTECLKLKSTTRLKPGDTVRVTAVTESCGVETRMSLFVNSKLEASDVMTGSACLCRPEFCVKGMKDFSGEIRNLLDCEMLDCRLYGIAFTPEEAAAL